MCHIVWWIWELSYRGHMCLCVVIFFFFSSRRRHTRYWRDWSSDVCSSDLINWTGRAGHFSWSIAYPWRSYMTSLFTPLCKRHFDIPYILYTPYSLLDWNYNVVVYTALHSNGISVLILLLEWHYNVAVYTALQTQSQYSA